MAAGYCYCLGIKSNDFFLKDNKKAFILWLNVPKVTAYYGFVHKIKDVDCESLLLGGHIVLLFVYRLVVILLIANVFFYTVYMITSLLQVLILKKKI